MRTFFYSFALICLTAPSIIYAGMPGEVPPDVLAFIQRVTTQIINPIIGILFAGALVYFLWGLLMFIFQADESSKREEYKQHMLWGLIGLTVMVSAYAILTIGLSTFGVDGNQLPQAIPLNPAPL